MNHLASRLSPAWAVSVFALVLAAAGTPDAARVLGIAPAGALGTLAGLRAIVSPASVAIAVASAVTVGLFFGYYPARRAAALDPLEALRAD